MTDVTVTPSPPSPQNQPGGDRTPDGTLKDVQTPGLETTPPKTDGSTESADGKSFITAKPEAPKAEGTPPPEGEAKDEKVPEGAPDKYEDFTLPDGYKFD